MNSFSATSKRKPLIALHTITAGCFALSVLLMTNIPAIAQAVEFQTIQGLFEPSGLVQLDDGRLLAVEDEPTKPFVLLTQTEDELSFSISKLSPNILFHTALTRVNDLEGVAKDADGYIYSITSHSRKSNGKRDPGREKIIQLSIKGDRLLKSNVRRDFRQQLTDAYPDFKRAAKERKVKDKGGLNIEGLTFSPDGDVLWIGFRAPLLDSKAILIGVLNSRSALESSEPFDFTDAPVLLDLDGGGIRDIAYDSTLSGYLILSQNEGTKKEKPFKLWLWSGNEQVPPSRVRITGIKKLNRTEGIAPVRLKGKDQLLLVNDDGNRAKNKPASYLLVDYTQLDIEDTP